MSLADLILFDETVKQLETQIRRHIATHVFFPPIIVDCTKECGQYAVVLPNKTIWWITSIEEIKFKDLPNQQRLLDKEEEC